jgi:catechol 2,3-dioxygenase-like lactoylglutathione lyase family enzyme
VANGMPRSGKRWAIIGVLGFVGGFVACFGLGNAEEVLLVTGIALVGAGVMFYLFDSRVANSLRTPRRQWLQAVGRVQEVLNEPPSDAQVGRCTLSLELISAGFTGVIVTTTIARVPVAHWPQVGQEIAVQVTQDPPHRVRVIWPDLSGGAPTVIGTPGPAEPVAEPIAEPVADAVIDFDIDNPPTQPLQPVGSAATTAAAGERRKPSPSPRPRQPDSRPTFPTARPAPSVAIHSVGITVPVSNLGDSISFYRDQLGFRELERGDDRAELAHGDMRLVLRESDTKISPASLTVDVEDLFSLFDDLARAGSEVAYAPRAVDGDDRLERWEAELRDPDGHAVTITQWRAVTAEAPTV